MKWQSSVESWFHGNIRVMFIVNKSFWKSLSDKEQRVVIFLWLLLTWIKWMQQRWNALVHWILSLTINIWIPWASTEHWKFLWNPSFFFNRGSERFFLWIWHWIGCWLTQKLLHSIEKMWWKFDSVKYIFKMTTFRWKFISIMFQFLFIKIGSIEFAIYEVIDLLNSRMSKLKKKYVSKWTFLQ